jgi:hypothetical protein
VKLIYATSADDVVAILQSRRFSRHTKRHAGDLMTGTGGSILIQA